MATKISNIITKYYQKHCLFTEKYKIYAAILVITNLF